MDGYVRIMNGCALYKLLLQCGHLSYGAVCTTKFTAGILHELFNQFRSKVVREVEHTKCKCNKRKYFYYTSAIDYG